jgi:hypothetical protein
VSTLLHFPSLFAEKVSSSFDRRSAQSRYHSCSWRTHKRSEWPGKSTKRTAANSFKQCRDRLIAHLGLLNVLPNGLLYLAANRVAQTPKIASRDSRMAPHIGPLQVVGTTLIN